MRNYRIGRIEGRWKNFLPPIQGGSFRSYVKKEKTMSTDEDEGFSSSSSESPPNSPLFDVASEACPSRRRYHVNISDNAEVSSISSISSAELNSALGKPRLSYLDMYTQEKLDFDHAKYPPLDHTTQDNIVSRYRVLNDRIRAEGLYQCNYTAYMIEIIRYTVLFGLCLLCLRMGW